MNKVVLITGSTKNTGLAIATKFASMGFNVCVSGRDKVLAETISEKLQQQYNVKCIGLKLDLEDPQNIKDIFSKIKSEFGRLDVFVANAANLGIGSSAIDMGEEELRSVINTNVIGNFLCCQESAGIMKENGGGSIVLIGSIHYKGAVFGRSAYATSKGAIASMVNNLAYEWAEYNIRVNQVVPGAIRTDRWDNISEEEEKKRRQNWPLGIESTGEDIANAVYFMASDDSKTITGSELTVDSGLTACLLKYERR